MMTTTYKVAGMTCDHCINAVTNELLALEGVTSVDISLDSGEVTVTNTRELAIAEVAAAVDEAGYELVLP
jgi:copper chaperone CopZ